MTPVAESGVYRRALVDALVTAGTIRSAAVRAAFEAVPRELFVAHLALVRGLAAIYADAHLITQERDGTPTSSSSQPSVMAEMLQALDTSPGQRVLEVGLGTGYNAALLSHLVGPTGAVTSVDIDPELVAGASAALARGGYPVHAVAGDGRAGWPDGAPFDRIIVTASATSVAFAWWEQLSPGGLLVVPLRVGAMQVIAVLARTDTGFRSMRLVRGGFMALRERDSGGAIALVDGQPTVSLRVALPDRPAANLSAFGPGLMALASQSLGSFLAHLLQPARLSAIEPVPAWPVIWHLVMTADPQRQVSVYGTPGRVRFGVVEPTTGAGSLLVAARIGESWEISTIESFGPEDSDGRAELGSLVTAWAEAGSPTFDQLTVEITYGQAEPVPGALRTVRSEDQVICLGWTTES